MKYQFFFCYLKFGPMTQWKADTLLLFNSDNTLVLFNFADKTVIVTLLCGVSSWTSLISSSLWISWEENCSKVLFLFTATGLLFFALVGFNLLFLATGLESFSKVVLSSATDSFRNKHLLAWDSMTEKANSLPHIGHDTLSPSMFPIVKLQLAILNFSPSRECHWRPRGSGNAQSEENRKSKRQRDGTTEKPHENNTVRILKQQVHRDSTGMPRDAQNLSATKVFRDGTVTSSSSC